MHTTTPLARSTLKIGTLTPIPSHKLSRTQYAATHGQEASVKLLLEAGASHTMQDIESGYSALHRAFLCCKLATAAALVRGGASIHSPIDHEGHTPLELLHRKWGRRAASADAALGEVYTWGDAGCAGLGRAVNGSQSRTAHAGRVETGERVIAVAAGKVCTARSACSGGRCTVWRGFAFVGCTRGTEPCAQSKGGGSRPRLGQRLRVGMRGQRVCVSVSLTRARSLTARVHAVYARAAPHAVHRRCRRRPRVRPGHGR